MTPEEVSLSKVYTHMTMSLDGYIADPDDRVDELFDWYQAGEVSVASHNADVGFDVDEASAEALQRLTATAGALVAGRRLFDIADGWNDTHPTGAPVVVVTHSAPANAAERWPRTTFIDGVEAAITTARHIAGDKDARSPAPTSSSRHSTSAWSTRYASAWCQCCSVRASPTSRNWVMVTCYSRTRL